MRRIEYTVIVHEAEEGGYWTEVPALPGAGSQGETVDDTIANTKESIELMLEYLRDKGEDQSDPEDIVLRVTEPAQGRLADGPRGSPGAHPHTGQPRGEQRRE